MKFCISTVKFSVIINGSREGFFPTERGLRQGDPLSPFLFIIAMEGLSNMIKKAKLNGWIKGFEVAMNGHNNQEITHLQYADDTLIFCDAEVEQLRVLRIILVLLEVISGLHINWRKSHLFPINEVTNMEDLALIPGEKWGLSLPLIWVCHWGPSQNLLQYGTMYWRNVRKSCQDENVNICQWEEGSL